MKTIVKNQEVVVGLEFGSEMENEVQIPFQFPVDSTVAAQSVGIRINSAHGHMTNISALSDTWSDVVWAIYPALLSQGGRKVTRTSQGSISNAYGFIFPTLGVVGLDGNTQAYCQYNGGESVGATPFDEFQSVGQKTDYALGIIDGALNWAGTLFLAINYDVVQLTVEEQLKIIQMCSCQ